VNNPLVESCLELSRAGYEHRDDVSLAWENSRFISLGNYLLNHSQLGRTFRLKPRRRYDKNRLAICFGAGIDSYIALFQALKDKRDVVLVWVDYGQPYARHERHVFRNLIGVGPGGFYRDAKTLLDRYGVHIQKDTRFEEPDKIPLLRPDETEGLDWQHYIIPARNLVLAAIASQYADQVWIVSNKRSVESVGTPDKTSRFYTEASDLFSQFYGRRVIVTTPFKQKSKLQAVQDYLEAGGCVQALRETFSCYTPPTSDELAQKCLPPTTGCGACLACAKRHLLFQGLNKETAFANPPWEGPHWAEYQQHERSKGR
jgi:7-cyano-7-deazaguanine synthase in queuosine biosynthesis